MSKRGRRQYDETKTKQSEKGRQIFLQHACFGLMTDWGLETDKSKESGNQAIAFYGRRACFLTPFVFVWVS
uniref:hypothetical protein n=1 Tax=Prevotella sp. TaxID=59823 RepID=UPI003FEECB41